MDKKIPCINLARHGEASWSRTEQFMKTIRLKSGPLYRFLHKSGTLLLLFLFSVALLSACSSGHKENLVYIGTYTGSGSEGIYAGRFDARNGILKLTGLAAKTENPSFLAADSEGNFLYAVNELDTFKGKPTGAISVFAIDNKSGNLEFLQQVSSLGSAPCHLSFDKTGKYLLVANYNGGNFAVFPVGTDGRLGTASAFIQDQGSSINPDRQAGPHAHSIQVTPDNKFVLVADLGIDKVLIYRLNVENGSLTPKDSIFINMNPGYGPRHLSFSADGKFIYILSEMSSTITVLAFEPETGLSNINQNISALPKNFNGTTKAAEIEMDDSGRYLYVSNRGADNIGCFRINKDDGSLSVIGWISSGGKNPRHFTIDPSGKWLICANQDTDNIVIFRIDEATGQLEQSSEITGVSMPVCIYIIGNK